MIFEFEKQILNQMSPFVSMPVRFPRMPCGIPAQNDRRPSTEAAKEQGICVDTLRSQLKAAGVQAGQADRRNRDSRRLRELEAEVRALRKQVSEKDEVIEVLKNPSAYFPDHRG